MTSIPWLLAGNPTIRWQALRDLTDAPGGAEPQVEVKMRPNSSIGFERSSV